MWQTKVFKTVEARQKWIDKNKGKYWIEPVLVVIHNGYAVEYKPLVKPTSFPL